MANMNIPDLSQDDLIGLGLSTAQIIESIERHSWQREWFGLGGTQGCDHTAQ